MRLHRFVTVSESGIHTFPYLLSICMYNNGRPAKRIKRQILQVTYSNYPAGSLSISHKPLCNKHFSLLLVGWLVAVQRAKNKTIN